MIDDTFITEETREMAPVHLLEKTMRNTVEIVRHHGAPRNMAEVIRFVSQVEAVVQCAEYLEDCLGREAEGYPDMEH